MLPLVLLCTATFLVNFASFSKTQLRVSASELAFQLAQPDTDPEDAKAVLIAKLGRQYRNEPLEVEHIISGGLSGVQITLRPSRSIALFGLSIPEIIVETHAANEI